MIYFYLTGVLFSVFSGGVITTRNRLHPGPRDHPRHRPPELCEGYTPTHGASSGSGGKKTPRRKYTSQHTTGK